MRPYQIAVPEDVAAVLRSLEQNRESDLDKWRRQGEEIEARRAAELQRRRDDEKNDQHQRLVELQSLLAEYVDTKIMAERERNHKLIGGVLNELVARIKKMDAEIVRLKDICDVDKGNIVGRVKLLGADIAEMKAARGMEEKVIDLPNRRQLHTKDAVLPQTKDAAS